MIKKREPITSEALTERWGHVGFPTGSIVEGLKSARMRATKVAKEDNKADIAILHTYTDVWGVRSYQIRYRPYRKGERHAKI